MNKERLFEFLNDQDAAVLLELLEAAFDEMKTDQRDAVFGEIADKAPPPCLDGEMLLDDVKEFQRESLAKVYYAPFSINSKNWTHVPEQTKEWFERLGELLTDSARLAHQGDHANAVAAFRILYELIDAMEEGQPIVFAKELDSSMIPVEEKEMIAVYMESLAAVATPEEFAVATIPLIKRDSYHSLAAKAYASAKRVANKEQAAHLKAEIKRQKIRTSNR